MVQRCDHQSFWNRDALVCRALESVSSRPESYFYMGKKIQQIGFVLQLLLRRRAHTQTHTAARVSRQTHIVFFFCSVFAPLGFVKIISHGNENLWLTVAVHPNFETAPSDFSAMRVLIKTAVTPLNPLQQFRVSWTEKSPTAAWTFKWKRKLCYNSYSASAAT